MKPIFRSWFRSRKSRIERRLDRTRDTATHRPVLSARPIDYDVSRRDRAIAHGGIGLIHTLARKVGLPQAIDERLHLLKVHLPYHESDHVLNIAYNALCHGTCLQDIDLRRNDDAFLDALGARRLPDPTTAGDFCRRFTAADLDTLQDAIDAARRNVWAEQPASFFDRATLDMDGTLVATTGACKAGMDIAYDGTWGYHPLVVSLAETGEVLRLVNRPGNRPSHEGAAAQVDRAILLCLQAGFRRVVLRGDTDFSQTEHLDRWHALPWVRFVFGYDARPNLLTKAEGLPASAWQSLRRPPRYEVKTRPRTRPEAVKDRIVRERNFEVLKLQSEEVAEFDYRPTACTNTYRMVVVRKHISREKGEQVLFPEVRYFFYLTNDRDLTAAEVVFEANARCDQENLLAQLHGGTHALAAPVDALVSNGAWMVMTALAWTLKAWWALLLPESPGRWQGPHREEKTRVLRMEFKTFVNTFVTIPCQVLRTGRRLVLRLLGWNPHLLTFFRLVSRLRE
ncbi:MAG: IS1380 family transposase [Gemmatimonadaceae bacterium]|nr:IS1380 family transposase [Gemmatimonadaceae bacterium]